MVKVYALFETKMAQKPYPLGLHIPTYMEEYLTPPPPHPTPGTEINRHTLDIVLQILHLRRVECSRFPSKYRMNSGCSNNINPIPACQNPAISA